MRAVTILIPVAISFAIGVLLAERASAQTSIVSPSPAAGAAGLSIVAQPGLQLFSASFARVNIGFVSPADQPSVVRTFTVRNDASSAVTVNALTPSCKCTSGKVEVGGAIQSLPASIQAGQAAQIVATVRIAILKPGPIDKFLAVKTHGSAWPAATFEIVGTVEKAKSAPASGAH